MRKAILCIQKSRLETSGLIVPESCSFPLRSERHNVVFSISCLFLRVQLFFQTKGTLLLQGDIWATLQISLLREHKHEGSRGYGDCHTWGGCALMA